MPMQSYVIKSLVRMLEQKDLVLPAMQRPFVWEEERIVRLLYRFSLEMAQLASQNTLNSWPSAMLAERYFKLECVLDSLMRRFPLGTVLVWATSEGQRLRPFRANAQTGEQPVFTFEHALLGDRKLYVLDGQQRLTTLLMAFKGTLDDKQLYLDMLSGSSSGKDPGDVYYDFRFLSAREADDLNKRESSNEEPRQFFLPCETFLKVEAMDAPLVAQRIARDRDFDEAEQTQLSTTYTRAAGVLVSEKALQVHVIDEDGGSPTPIEEILEIFVRVNSGGLELNKSDLLMSLLDMSWQEVQPALMRCAQEASAHSPLEVTRDMILKTALLYVGEESRFHKLVADRDAVARIAPSLENAIDPVHKG